MTGAAQYDLYVQDAGTSAIILNNTSVTGNTYALSTPLTAGHSYTWYVGAEGAVGANGPISWSTADMFTLAQGGG